MKRRTFFRAGAGAAAGAALGTPGPAAAALPASRSAAVLRAWPAEEQRRRLENIARLEHSVRRCLRRHLITDYLPGHCCYNLNEYPARKPWEPDDWDEAELDRLHAHGIRLIQVHEEWNDSQRLFGGDKFSPAHPAGFRRFVEMVHRRGLKLIVYVSAGYFQRTDPDFRPEWATPAEDDLVELYFRYAHCSPASPGWRAYLLPRVARILDEYGIDGLYNDLGYVQPGTDALRRAGDQVLAFEESPTRDGALGDLLGLIYAEVKRRGGVVKVHRGGPRQPLTDFKTHDYLWVGEAGRDGDKLRELSKGHTPYVIPCLDMSRATIGNEDELYLHSIPYLQFPLLLAGRPFTGERAAVPGIAYPRGDKCFWTRHCRAIWQRYQAHPDGPHSYGWWDSDPGRPEARPTHAKWLGRYLPLVEEGTWAWIEIAESDLFPSGLPEGVTASGFANRQLHLVLANYRHSPCAVDTRDAFVPVEAPEGASPRRRWELPARALAILRRVDAA